MYTEHDGVVLNDYVELSEYPQLYDPAARTATGAKSSDVSVLKIVPDFYDERAARIHVRRLRDILVNPPAHVTHYTGVLTDKEAATAAGTTGRTKSTKSAPVSDKKPTDAKAEEKTSGSAPPAAAAAAGGDTKTAAPAAGGVVLVADEKKTLLSNGAMTVAVPGSEEKMVTIDPEAEPVDFSLFTLKPFHYEKDERKREAANECVRNINFSAWNPPPGNRQLRGDLLYLEVSPSIH